MISIKTTENNINIKVS